MQSYTIKVKHRRFLNKEQADSLSKYGIKVILNNHVYDEYSAHMPTKIDLSKETVDDILKSFKSTIEENIITIEI
jgi:lipid II:glycine glycyltransferase (peptidoglycan interpeptide bridge formation enzyme)